MTTKNLEQDLAEVQERLAARRAEIERIAVRLAQIPAALVDAAIDSDRVELHAEYGELTQERELWLLECKELERRERLARLAILENEAAAAKAELDRAEAEAAKLREAAKAAQKDALQAANGRIPEEARGDQTAIELYKIDLEAKRRTAWALASAADKELRKLGKTWQAAQERVEQAAA